MATPLALSSVQTDIELPRNCTFDADDWAILARYWYPIALVRDVGTKPLSAKLLDEPLVIYQVGEEIVIARDICPHRGVPLSLGRQVDGGVAWRLSRFAFRCGGTLQPGARTS